MNCRDASAGNTKSIAAYGYRAPGVNRKTHDHIDATASSDCRIANFIHWVANLVNKVADFSYKFANLVNKVAEFVCRNADFVDKNGNSVNEVGDFVYFFGLLLMNRASTFS